MFRISGGRAFNRELGLGHVYRSINLASELKKNKIFFLIEDYGQVKKTLKKYGYDNIFLLKKGLSVNTDLKETLKLINRKKIDILIVDKFDSNTKKYVKTMKKKIKTVVIPDVWKIDYDANLVINGFIGYENKIIQNKYGTKCLLGPAYQILNKRYEKRERPQRKNFTILATFGGFDEHNVIEIFYNQLLHYLDKITTKIILGPATIKSRNVKSVEFKNKKHIVIIQETKNMKKEIASAEFGICGGGLTTYEFAAMGLPFAIICQYKHQLKTAREWEKRKIALNLGFPSSRTKTKIQNLLKNISEEKIPIKPKKSLIVDGLGAKRVAREILSLAD